MKRAQRRPEPARESEGSTSSEARLRGLRGRETAEHSHRGNQRLQQLLADEGGQPKLRVSDPDDRDEKEAERIAETVMRMPAPTRTETSSQDNSYSDTSLRVGERSFGRHRQVKPLTSPSSVRGREREEDRGNGMPFVDVDAHHRVESLRGGGQPLPESVRSFFEPRFGHDFSDVRVHTGTEADEATRSIDAEAFTVGADVVLRNGKFQPDTSEGRKLLAHELTHVRQQERRDAPRIQRQVTPGSEATVHAQDQSPQAEQAQSSEADGADQTRQERERPTVIATGIRPTGTAGGRGRTPEGAPGQEVQAGVQQLKANIVGQTLLTLQQWEAGRTGDPVGYATTAAQEVQSLQTVSQHVFFLANRAYLLDSSGNVVRGGHEYPLGWTDLEPGGVYFSAQYIFGELGESGSFQPEHSLMVVFRLGGDGVTVASGDFGLSNFYAQMAELKPRLAPVEEGTAGMGVVVSDQIGADQPYFDHEHVEAAFAGAFNHLEWAARERLLEAIENPADEIVQTLIDLAIDKLVEAGSRVFPMLGPAVMLFDTLQLTGWLADVVRVAAYARSQSEVVIASQSIARRVVDEVWAEIKAGSVSRLSIGERVRRERPKLPPGEDVTSGRDRDRSLPEQHAEPQHSRPERVSERENLERLDDQDVAWLEGLEGISTDTWQASFRQAGDDIIHAVKRFRGAPGFRTVVKQYLARGTSQEGARFVLRFAITYLRDSSRVSFEAASIQLRNDPAAREVDVRADGIWYECKNVKEVPHDIVSGRRENRGTVGDFGQFVRDVAARRDDTENLRVVGLRWVFNENKIGSREVIIDRITEKLSRQFLFDHHERETLRNLVDSIVVTVDVQPD